MVNSRAVQEPVHLPNELSSGDTPGGFDLPLTSVFRPNCIEIIRPASGRTSVISLLIRALAREERIDRAHAETIISGLLERERYGTSAIGNGLAFPNLRTQNVTRFVGAIGVVPDGVNFASLDDGPTKLVFLTLSPWEAREQHMNLLSRLVSLMRDKAFSMHLHHQICPQDVYNYLADLDQQSQLLNAIDQMNGASLPTKRPHDE